jgi:hypothetical protein
MLKVHERENTLTLVPTARLELAQLSPLPPQDSVSTNFTTSAFRCSVKRTGLRPGCVYQLPATWAEGRNCSSKIIFLKPLL